MVSQLMEKYITDMQTFLPFSNFEQCAATLDKKRCFKQVVEAAQIIKTLIGQSTAWKNHPVMKQWTGYVNCLSYYHNVFYNYCKTVYDIQFVKSHTLCIDLSTTIVYPRWFSDERIFYSHRCRLLAKAIFTKNVELLAKLTKQGITQENHDINTPYFWVTS